MASDHDLMQLTPGLDGLHASSDLSALGTLHLSAPTSDINGDGILDTLVEHDGGAQFVLTDTNRDGLADHLTIVDSDGQFAAWVFHPGGGAHWTQIDRGRVGR